MQNRFRISFIFFPILLSYDHVIPPYLLRKTQFKGGVILFHHCDFQTILTSVLEARSPIAVSLGQNQSVGRAVFLWGTREDSVSCFFQLHLVAGCQRFLGLWLHDAILQLNRHIAFSFKISFCFPFIGYMIVFKVHTNNPG